MRKRTRRILFYVAVGVFVIGSISAMLYAQGYSYSFSDNRLVKTGAIVVRVNTSATIYRDGERVGATSFLGNSFGIVHLLPGQYEVRVARDGYSTWKKVVRVDEGLVTEFPEVVLLPQTNEGIQGLRDEVDQLFATYASASATSLPRPTPVRSPVVSPVGSVSPTPVPSSDKSLFVVERTVLRQIAPEEKEIADGVIGFQLSDSGQKLLYWTAHDVNVLWVRDDGVPPFHRAGDIERITRFSSLISRAVWFRDEYHIVADTGMYTVVETDARGGTNSVVF